MCEVKNGGGWFDLRFLFALSWWGGAAAGHRATKRDNDSGDVNLPSRA